MGTGSNMFRSGIVHSSGVIYIGTYGPAPAIVWKYDPKVGKLQEVGRPGEYQLDCMVEAPNGIVYIGTAYEGLIYRLDPKTEKITSLGTPAIASTPWIFTMICTKAGEIYGAKGVGLFRLDWQKDTIEPIGIVPGEHRTLQTSSEPIIRTLVESPDGRIYGDTNRWLFRFDPRQRKIDPLVDMCVQDDANYALFICDGIQPDNDCAFTIFSRYSGKAVKNEFYIYRNSTNKLESVKINGWDGPPFAWTSWLKRGQAAHALMPAWDDEQQRTRIYEIDLKNRKLFATWNFATTDYAMAQLPGKGFIFYTSTPGKIFEGNSSDNTVRVLAENPMPVECRCLAASPQGLLGADTYDCGFMFTRSLSSGDVVSHGRVWKDDHRCNYGPAAFTNSGQHFIANHSEQSQGLWVTDVQADRHWRIGEPAIQLVAMSGGSVWGTLGPNPSSTHFAPASDWLPSWQSKPGAVFRYQPGVKQVELMPALGELSCLAEAPGGKAVMAVRGNDVLFFDQRSAKPLQRIALPDSIVAVAHDAGRTVCYLLSTSRDVYVCNFARGSFSLTKKAGGFGAADRGFFVVPKTGRLIGVTADGTVSVFDPATAKISQRAGEPPQPAGPAVDPTDDAWYYADREVRRTRLID
jgi:hypothetical protein